MRFSLLMMLVAGLCATSAANFANGQTSELISASSAKRAGMEIMWRTQVRMGATSRLQNLTQIFGKSKKLVKYVVAANGIVEEFFEDDSDRFGRKIGVAGAKARADAKVARYKSIGLDAKIERIVEDPDALAAEIAKVEKEYATAKGFKKAQLLQQLSAMNARRARLVPEITFLAQNTTSVVQSIDGRTGKTNWVQQIGKRNHPCQPVVASGEHFSVVNASNVYCGLLSNGRIVWERECRGAPGSRSAMTRSSIFVPMVNGFVEQFSILNGNAPTGDIVSIGHSLLGATSSDTVVAWPSDRGELNVAYDTREASQVSYRLVPKKEIVSNAAFQSPYLFATSTDGSLFCLREVNGTMIWDLPTGVPIRKSPVVVGKHVYFININNVLTQVLIDGGIPTWETDGVSKILSISSKRIYGLDKLGHLIAIDLQTGRMLGKISSYPLDFAYQNTLTDRLIIGTKDGRIQCLREMDQVEPIFHSKPESAAESTAEPKQDDTTPKAQDPMKNNNNADPFGGGADDPFGGGGGGGGGGKAADDPLGGGGGGGADDDPFGN